MPEFTAKSGLVSIILATEFLALQKVKSIMEFFLLWIRGLGGSARAGLQGWAWAFLSYGANESPVRESCKGAMFKLEEIFFGASFR